MNWGYLPAYGEPESPQFGKVSPQFGRVSA